MDITIVTFIEKAVSNDVFFFTAERILSNFGVSFSEKMGRSGHEKRNIPLWAWPRYKV